MKNKYHIITSHKNIKDTLNAFELLGVTYDSETVNGVNFQELHSIAELSKYEFLYLRLTGNPDKITELCP